MRQSRRRKQVTGSIYMGIWMMAKTKCNYAALEKTMVSECAADQTVAYEMWSMGESRRVCSIARE
jgi:hypothetical protein